MQGGLRADGLREVDRIGWLRLLRVTTALQQRVWNRLMQDELVHAGERGVIDEVVDVASSEMFGTLIRFLDPGAAETG